MKHKRILSLLLAFLMLAALASCAGTPAETTTAGTSAAADVPAEPELEPGNPSLCIVYTNDVHCGAGSDPGYERVAEVAAALEAAGKTVLLADAGDAVQGGLTGTLTKGSAIISLMNAAGYDVMTLGNHEFDYGIPRLLELADEADFPFVCCNFTDASGDPLFAPYVILEADGVKVAFVGVSTPTTLWSSTPSYFRDGEGNVLYSFCEDETGKKLADTVSAAAAGARDEGADYVVVLAHLGTEGAASPYTSAELIPMTAGVDVLLDGHSHTVMECEYVKDSEGKSVLVSQTGTKLENIGILTLGADGVFTASLINSGETAGKTAEIQAEQEELTGEVIGETLYPLTICDPEDPAQRLVRLTETNLGDLCADAVRWRTGADVGVVNGGGVRVSLPAGDITVGDLISVMPFGNAVSVVRCTGSQILDALEISVSRYPDENGGYLQVSGITFTVDVSVPSCVVRGDDGMASVTDGDRRVSGVCIGGKPLDPDAEYTVGGVDYVLLQNGDGCTAFDGAEVTQREIALDYQVLIDYIREVLGGTVGAEYADPFGDRVTFAGHTPAAR